MEESAALQPVTAGPAIFSTDRRWRCKHIERRGWCHPDEGRAGCCGRLAGGWQAAAGRRPASGSCEPRGARVSASSTRVHCHCRRGAQANRPSGSAVAVRVTNSLPSGFVVSPRYVCAAAGPARADSSRRRPGGQKALLAHTMATRACAASWTCRRELSGLVARCGGCPTPATVAPCSRARCLRCPGLSQGSLLQRSPSACISLHSIGSCCSADGSHPRAFGSNRFYWNWRLSFGFCVQYFAQTRAARIGWQRGWRLAGLEEGCDEGSARSGGAPHRAQNRSEQIVEQIMRLD